jgi:hypothetical protein
MRGSANREEDLEMIQNYPNATQLSDLQCPDPPAAVLQAVRVMYLGAVLCVAHAVIYVATIGAEKAALARHSPNVSAHNINALAHIVVISESVLALIGAVLFAWIAHWCMKGRNGARTSGTVFFVIAVLGMAYDFLSPETTLNLVFVVVVVMTGLVAVVLLWQRRSSAYFRFFRRPQF